MGIILLKCLIVIRLVTILQGNRYITRMYKYEATQWVNWMNASF